MVKSGDLYQHVEHRLLCGDATSRSDVDALMSGNKATMCFADPPYGMGKEAEGVVGDNLNNDDLLEFNRAWIPISLDALTDIGSWYCWGRDRGLMEVWSLILRPEEKNRPLTLKNLITWDKGNAQGILSGSQRSYAIASEKCLFVMLGRQATWSYSTNADNYWEGWEPIRAYLEGERQKMGWKPTDIKRITGVGMYSHWFTKSQFVLLTKDHYEQLQAEANGEAFKREYDELRHEYDEIKRYYDEHCRSYFDNCHDSMTDVWHIQRASEDEHYHPTTKPYAVCARAIKSSIRPGDLVLDPFAGGGSVLMACEKLDRVCYALEISPHWCQVIIDRYEAETGNKAIKLCNIY